MEILEEVLKAYDGYDYNLYTKDDVLTALSKDTVSAEDYKALLSPAAMEFLEPMARRAKKETMSISGILSVFSRPFISRIIVSITAYTADLTARIKSTGRSLRWRRLSGNTRLSQRQG